MFKSDKAISFWKELSVLQSLWMALLIGLLFFNMVSLGKAVTQTKHRRQSKPYIFYGIAYAGLNKFLNGVEAIGYYTDRDLDENSHAAAFAQAQYMLAPIMVDLDYAKYEFIIFDCSSEEKAMAKINELGAIPLKKNKFGVILAQQEK